MTTDNFLDLVRRSGVVEREGLEEFLAAFRKASPPPGEAVPLAEALVAAGLLTPFQANHLLQGRWRGFLIGKYRVLDLLGATSTGRVFLCEHPTMRRLVAVKVVAPGYTKDPSVVPRLYREARAVAALDHPNIARGFDIDCIGDMHFLVLEFLDGGSLANLVGRHGPLIRDAAVNYIWQASQGLQHAHEAGWIHRDTNPSNLLVDRQGVIKLLDLGLARPCADTRDPITQTHDRNNILGTIDYLGPEQATSNQVDPRTDIYGLGCTFYFLLAGRPPFPQGNIAEKLLQHQLKEATPIRSLRPDIPEELAAILRRMIAKQPAERLQTAKDVGQALLPWLKAQLLPPSAKEMPTYCPAVHFLLQLRGKRS